MLFLLELHEVLKDALDGRQASVAREFPEDRSTELRALGNAPSAAVISCTSPSDASAGRALVLRGVPLGKYDAEGEGIAWGA